MYTWDKRFKSLPMSGLAMELPGMTCEHMSKIFGYGAGKSMQNRDKYSDSLIIVNKATDEIFSLYMSYGEWRIGAGGRITNNTWGRDTPRELIGVRGRDAQVFADWLRMRVANLK